jgi:hypothetical protein
MLNNFIGTYDAKDELIAAFRDDMLHVSQAQASEYHKWDKWDEGEDRHIEVAQFLATGGQIADRLDLLGVNSITVRAVFNEVLADARAMAEDARKDQTLAALQNLDADKWIELVKSSNCNDPGAGDLRRPGSRAWLIDFLRLLSAPYALRMLLLATPPDIEVSLDATYLGYGYWHEGAPALPSNALERMGARAASKTPTLVLTEGRTDAEFLSVALKILYPHLTDLVRFLDYEARPEGGAGALVRLVRSFAAAGVANRTVAVFDNDTAAADALRALTTTRLPANIRVIKYPDTELAADYPTLGPPTATWQTRSPSTANVNGLAGSIELYLGLDVLTNEIGELRPVQWKSFLPGIGQYQGEVIDKADIHSAFRRKYAAILGNQQDCMEEAWTDMRLVLDAILSAFERP